MSSNKSFPLVIVVAMALVAPVSIAADQSSFDACMAKAKEARQQAASVGGEWRDVGKFMKQARQAADGGDWEAAMKKCRKAELQSRLGYEQALAEAEAGMPSYMRR
jgi:hypothetical protein